MKTVYTSSTDVIHLFAQQSQNSARCSNVFFYDSKIYSYGYHYVLGQFITNPKGEEAIMINDTGYSKTTSKHVSEITQATRQFRQFFKQSTDLQLITNEVLSNIGKLKNARKKEKYIIPSLALFEYLNAYLDWNQDVKTKKSVDYKKLVDLISVINGGDFAAYLAKDAKRIKAERAKQEKLKEKQLSESIEKFKNFETSRIYNSNEDFLRISKDKESVETSQGVTVSKKEAQTLYNLILNKKDIQGFNIAGYTVISLNGTLKIGCHHINTDSMHEVGKQLITI